jgi:hypothetical protein
MRNWRNRICDIRQDAVAIVEELAAKVNVVLALGKPLTASCMV